MRRIPEFTFALAVCIGCSLPLELVAAPTEKETSTSGTTYLTSDYFDVEGLPQQQYSLNTEFANGQLTRLEFGGSVGFIITPRGKADAKRSWVWIVPLWLALPSKHGDYLARFYVEKLLEQGIHVVGFDVGTSLGSPKGAALFARFYDYVIQDHKLAPRANLRRCSGVISGELGQSSRRVLPTARTDNPQRFHQSCVVLIR
jgi:hypothetical protein